MTWIQTASGKAVDLLNPAPETIDIQDVAHALSLICRFTGHTSSHYSVAQHSVLVSELLPESVQLYGLLHDAHEAYIGDISTPMKWSLGEDTARLLASMADNFDSAIHAVAGLGEPSHDIKAAIKVADLQMLMAERRDLLGKSPRTWGNYETVKPAPHLVEPWCAADSKVEFLAIYKRLQDRRRMRADFLAH